MAQAGFKPDISVICLLVFSPKSLENEGMVPYE